MSFLSDDEKQAVIHEVTVFAFGTTIIVITLELLTFLGFTLAPQLHAVIIIVALITSFIYDDHAYTGHNVTKREKLVRLLTNLVLFGFFVVLSGPILTRFLPPPPIGRVANAVYTFVGYGLVFAMYRSILLSVTVILTYLV